jgi:hypothetical protein
MKRKIPINYIECLSLEAFEDITFLDCDIGFKIVSIEMRIGNSLLINVASTHTAILNPQAQLN